MPAAEDVELWPNHEVVRVSVVIETTELFTLFATSAIDPSTKFNEFPSGEDWEKVIGVSPSK